MRIRQKVINWLQERISKGEDMCGNLDCEVCKMSRFRLYISDARRRCYFHKLEIGKRKNKEILEYILRREVMRNLIK